MVLSRTFAEPLRLYGKCKSRFYPKISETAFEWLTIWQVFHATCVWTNKVHNVQVVKVCPERGAVQVHNPKGQDKVFTYDAAYDCEADTQTIYDEMVSYYLYILDDCR